jgi:hypothetical protein
MADPRFITLISRLLARSREGKVAWEATAEEGTYQAAFPQYSVKVFAREGQEGVDYVLQVADDKGQVIDEISDPDFPDQLQNMRELFNHARSTALGVDRALHSILSALERDESQPEVPSPPDIKDEDIPF